MDSHQNRFLTAAAIAIARGLKVVPLKPRSKDAFERGWQDRGYSDLQSLSAFDENCNLGALCSKDGTWILDVDSPDWFTDSVPKKLVPDLFTYCVKTGSGGYQYHFLQDDHSRSLLSNRSLKNPDPGRWKKASGAECHAVIEVLFDRKQGVLPPSVHPETGREYSVHKDIPLVCAAGDLVSWIQNQFEKTKSDERKAVFSPFKTRKGWEPERELAKAGLKFERFEQDGKTFFNYHHLMGKCLVRGSSHAAPGEVPNDRQTAFVHDPVTRQLWHKCFSAGCRESFANTKKALTEIGIESKDVFETLPAGSVRLTLEKASDSKPKAVEWIWPGWLMRGVCNWSGESGEGKSPASVEVGARVSAGLAWPDGARNELGPRTVVLMAGEDDWESVTVPRLISAGADLSRVYRVVASQVSASGEEIEVLASLERDLGQLIELAATNKAALVVGDPISNYLGRVSINKEEEVRRVLMDAHERFRAIGCCFLIITHFNKRARADLTNAGQRVMGAKAFIGVSRCVAVFGADPEDPDKYAHVMAPHRTPDERAALRMVTVKKSWEKDGVQGEVAVVEWRGESSATSEDVANPEMDGRGKKMFAEAAAEVRKLLSKGKTPVDEIWRHLEQFDFDVAVLRKNSPRLRKKAGAEAEKVKGDKGRVSWFIPAPEDLQRHF